MKTDCLGETQIGRARARGFTLVELMVTVAIAAILLSLAVPAYREYLRRGAVAEAVAVIGQGRVVAEQFFLDNRNYTDMPCPASTDSFDIVCDPGRHDLHDYRHWQRQRGGLRLHHRPGEPAHHRRSLGVG